MAEYLVTCINKNQDGSHEQITHIGNLADQWRITKEAAIHQIESNQSKFYIMDRPKGRRFYLTTVKELRKPPYLRAHADGRWTDHLLTLPECDETCKIVA